MHKEQDTPSASVVDQLRDMMMSGDLAAGAVLNQTELGDTLGVSRTPIRDALRQLESEGLVEISTSGRAKVAAVSADELLEYYEVRVQLETWLLSLSVPVMNNDDLDYAEQLLEQLDTCSQEEWSELNLAFHAALYAPAQRPYIIGLIQQLSQSKFRRLRDLLLISRQRDRSHRDHREILTACRNRDVQAAVDRLEAHIMLHGQETVNHIRRLEQKTLNSA